MSPPRPRAPQLLVALVFLVSGVAALVYEVVWTRFLNEFLGNTAHAHAVVLATFMGGLALGYEIFGRVADRQAARPDGARRLLTLYAGLEGGIGLYGLLFPTLMGAAQAAFIGAARSLGPDSAAILPLSLAVAIAVLIVPTVLMGGTLPVLIAWAAGKPDEAGPAVARFYAVNSAGAIVGGLLTGFHLIETYGLRRTVYIAAALNLLLTVIAFAVAALGRASSPGPSTITDEEPAGAVEPPGAHAPAWLPRFAAFGSGLVALVLEVVWIRVFTLVFGSSTQSFTVIVAAFITGITIGSGVASRLLRTTRRPLLLLGAAAAASGAIVLLSQPAYAWLPYWLAKLRMHFAPGGGAPMADAGSAFLWFQAAKFGVSFAFMVVPTAVSGLVLPLAVHLAARTPGHTGREVGRTFAWNTIGSVLGAALTGTVLIPLLSIRGCLVLGIVLYLVIAFAAVSVAREDVAARRLLVAVGLGAALLPLAEWKLGWDRHILNAGEFRRNSAVPSHDEWLKEQRKAELVFYEEGATTTVAVMRTADDRRFLKVNGKADASNWGDVATQAGIGALGALLADQAQSALVIGFGSGVTANVLSKFGLDVDVVEIEPAVLHAAPQFKDINDDVLKDPRVHVHIADARTFVQVADKRYDVLISEPSNPWVAGIGSLFTKEFFQVAKDHLSDGGAFVQWFHLYDMDDEMVKLILRTVSSVFSDVTVWHIENDIAIVARKKPFDRDIDRVQARFNLEAVRRYFFRVNVYDLFALLSWQLASEDGFRALVPKDGGPVHVDDVPLLEYRAPRAQFSRAYSFYVTTHDERRSLGPENTLLFSEFLRKRKIGTNEMINFTELQSAQPWSPAPFRFLFFDKILAECKEPWTLGRIANNLERTHKSKEADQVLAALERLDPGSTRTEYLHAQIALKRLGQAKAVEDLGLRSRLTKCSANPTDDTFRKACRLLAQQLGIALPQ